MIIFYFFSAGIYFRRQNGRQNLGLKSVPTLKRLIRMPVLLVIVNFQNYFSRKTFHSLRTGSTVHVTFERHRYDGLTKSVVAIIMLIIRL